MTYTRSAANEIRERLEALAPRNAGRAWVGTVHGFCLTTILAPFSEVFGYPRPSDSVLDTSSQVELLQRSFQTARITEQPATERFLSFTGTKVRRRIAIGESPEPGDDRRWYTAMAEYENELRSSGAVDFEGMPIRALELLREHPQVAHLLRSRYPWVLVDEYQDLGGVLHAIVNELRAAGVKIVGVGDPNQCIMGFSGADPRYFASLRAAPGIEPFDLPDNFRSSDVVVRASDRVLGINEFTPRSARESTEFDYVSIKSIAGGFSQHSRQAAEAALELAEAGVALSDIAILYKQQVLYPGGGRKIEIKNGILSDLKAVGLEYFAEQGTIWPRSDLTDFIRDCAIVALDRKSRSTSSVRLRELAKRYCRLVGVKSDDAVVTAQLRLHCTLPTEASLDWSANYFLTLLQASPVKLLESSLTREDDREALAFFTGPQSRGATLAELIGRSEDAPKITVATYQGAKGREWQYVILPFVVEGHIPSYYRGSAQERDLPENRRMLHVAISRPKAGAVVLTAPGSASNGLRFGSRSRFLLAFEEREA